ncbi:MAG: hypothetical protein LLG20_26250 [Acidobacteriales bacterium]|nr:hypothetical protein [Terriglobales bacterium]
MWIAGVVITLLVVLGIYEYRLRKPDQLVLYETAGTIRLRGGAIYPRHFSLALPGTTHQTEQKIDSIARGSVLLRTTLAVTVAPSRDNLLGLVRVGGWQRDAVVKASKEFETVIQGIVKAFTEGCLIEDLSSENLQQHLWAGAEVRAARFGLELVSLTVQSVDAVDPEIAEAMRRRESARILEQTEQLNQAARVSAARAKLQADEQIALAEHELELKRSGLREEELAREAILAEKRTSEELKRSRMKLAYENEELALLKSSPELLLLSPQAARLAEASQNLKNARTIVSLWSSDAERESRLSNLFQRFLELVLEGDKKQLKPDGGEGG